MSLHAENKHPANENKREKWVNNDERWWRFFFSLQFEHVLSHFPHMSAHIHKVFQLEVIKQWDTLRYFYMYARGATYIYMYIVALTWLIIAKAGKMLVIYVFPIQQNIQQMYAEIQKKYHARIKKKKFQLEV